MARPQLQEWDFILINDIHKLQEYSKNESKLDTPIGCEFQLLLSSTSFLAWAPNSTISRLQKFNFTMTRPIYLCLWMTIEMYQKILSSPLHTDKMIMAIEFHSCTVQEKHFSEAICIVVVDIWQSRPWRTSTSIKLCMNPYFKHISSTGC